MFSSEKKTQKVTTLNSQLFEAAVPNIIKERLQRKFFLVNIAKFF